MLRKDRGRVGLGDPPIAYTDQAISVAQKRRLVGWYELGMFNGPVWQVRFRLKCESRADGGQHKARESEGPGTFHGGDFITGSKPQMRAGPESATGQITPVKNQLRHAIPVRRSIWTLAAAHHLRSNVQFADDTDSIRVEAAPYSPQ